MLCWRKTKLKAFIWDKITLDTEHWWSSTSASRRFNAVKKCTRSGLKVVEEKNWERKKKKLSERVRVRQSAESASVQFSQLIYLAEVKSPKSFPSSRSRSVLQFVRLSERVLVCATLLLHSQSAFCLRWAAFYSPKKSVWDFSHRRRWWRADAWVGELLTFCCFLIENFSSPQTQNFFYTPLVFVVVAFFSLSLPLLAFLWLRLTHFILLVTKCLSVAAMKTFCLELVLSRPADINFSLCVVIRQAPAWASKKADELRHQVRRESAQVELHTFMIEHNIYNYPKKIWRKWC